MALALPSCTIRLLTNIPVSYLLQVARCSFQNSSPANQNPSFFCGPCIAAHSASTPTPYPLVAKIYLYSCELYSLICPTSLSRSYCPAHIPALAASLSCPAGITSCGVKAGPYTSGDNMCGPLVYITFLHNKSSITRENCRPSM